MIASLKAETKKLLTVRSTYFIVGLAFLLEFFVAFYVAGWKIDSGALHDPTTLTGDVFGAIAVLSVFVAIIAVLLVTHEYRYNTIMHTLTLSNSRTRILFSKAIVISVFALILTAVFAILSPLLSLLGIHLHHLHLVHQNINYWNVVWRSLFYGWGFVMAGFVIAMLVRNQVGAIVTLFILPSTVENLLGLLLKSNQAYLPFSALHIVGGQNEAAYHITIARAAVVSLTYLVVAFIASWYLFLHRDAN